MQKLNDQKLYRIIDANFNRTKEGLRVCEDICRFVLDEKSATRKYKEIRHDLTKALSSLKYPQIIQAREIEKDVGKGSVNGEFKRKSVSDVFYANAQRVKESIRVLEEFTKLVHRDSARKLKAIRYKTYAIEKKVSSKL